MSAVPVSGRVEPGWEKVREAFETNWAVEGAIEVGAGVAVYHRGRPVVDLTGGWFDVARTTLYGDQALQLVFSTTKGMAAVCAAVLVERGLLDPDATVASYWPEFAAAGKGAVTVAQLLSHRAGLPTVDPVLSLDEVLAWDPIAAALAAQAPYWEPGTAHGYHALTYGWLVGELVRRIDGRSIGAFYAAEVAAPLGLEAWIGLPPTHEPRVSSLLPPAPPPPEIAAMMAMIMGPETLGGRALSLNGTFALDAEGGDSVWNRVAVHEAEIPAANGIANAGSLARMYAATLGEVDGVRLYSDATRATTSATLTSGPDQCLVIETTFGLGFMTHGPFIPMAGPGSYGHAGAGGSLAFAHPDSGLAFAYVMNQMDANLVGDLRAARLVEAALACA